MSRTLFAVAAFAAAAGPAAADGTYHFTLDSQQIALSTNVELTAPTTGTLIGNYDLVSNPTGTRTKPGFFGSFGDTENVPVPLMVGVIVGGDNTTNPTGLFTLRLDVAGQSAGLSGLSVDLLGGDAAAIGVTANVLWDTFRTRTPTCIVPGGFTIPIPLGEAAISTLTADQDAGEAVGTLASTGPDTYLVTIPVTLSVAIGASFLDQEIPPTPQDVPVVFVAVVTVGPDGATITAEIQGFEGSQEQEGPIGEPFEIPFTEPICQGGLLFNLQLNGLTVSSSVSGQLVASGEKSAPACPCDWNESGDVEVSDIFAFLNAWFAGDGDFDGVGGTQVPDIFAFLACWFSPPAGC